MKFCQYCGFENDDSTRFCKRCGSDGLKNTPALKPSSPVVKLKKVFNWLKLLSCSKHTAFAIFILAIACPMANYILCYCYGFYQKPWDFFFYAELLGLFGLILFPVLVILWIINLIRRKYRFLTTAMLAGLIIFVWLKSTFPKPHDLIFPAMRDGMLRHYKLQDLRNFARDVDRLSFPGDRLNTGERVFMHEDLDQVKAQLKGKYPFLDHCGYIAETDEVVSLEWGGFEDHWGFSVAVNGKRIDPQNLEPSSKIIRVSDDIFFQSDY